MIPIVLKTEPTLVTKFARTTHDGRVARRDVTRVGLVDDSHGEAFF